MTKQKHKCTMFIEVTTSASPADEYKCVECNAHWYNIEITPFHTHIRMDGVLVQQVKRVFKFINIASGEYYEK